MTIEKLHHLPARKSAGFTLLLATILLLAVGCKQEETPPSYHTTEGEIWTTAFHCQYESDRDLSDSILSVLKRVDNSLSMFNPASTVSHINAASDMHTDPMLEDVLGVARSVWRSSYGAYDPTVAPLVDLWGYGRNAEAAGQPTQAEVDSALQLVGLNKCHVRNGVVSFDVAGMNLDFSSIAKGYAADRVVRMLERLGCRNYIFEIGGEVRANGERKGGGPWRVKIDVPIQAADKMAADEKATDVKATGKVAADKEETEMENSGMEGAIVDLSKGALATSGNYRRFRMEKGKMIGHTIDPTTGRPVAASTIAATIYAPTCCLADAYATACMALSPGAALDMIQKQPGIELLLIVADGDNVRIEMTDGFKEKFGGLQN